MIEPVPTREEFIQAILAERSALADLVECMSPEQWRSPSLCRGWSVGEVIYHLVFADRWRLEPLWDLLRGKGPFTYLHDWQCREAALGPHRALAALRSGRTSFTARWGRGIGARGNYGEQLIHAEDVRRPLEMVRDEPQPERLAWPALKVIASWQRNRLQNYGRLCLATPSGRSMTITRRFLLGQVVETGDGADARIEGEPLELLLYITGRDAEVTVSGQSLLAEEVLQSPLRFM